MNIRTLNPRRITRRFLEYNSRIMRCGDDVRHVDEPETPGYIVNVLYAPHWQQYADSDIAAALKEIADAGQSWGVMVVWCEADGRKTVNIHAPYLLMEAEAAKIAS